MTKSRRKERHHARADMYAISVRGLTEADLRLSIEVFRKEYGNLRGFRQAWERLCLECQSKCGQLGWHKGYKMNLPLLIETAYKSGDQELIDLVEHQLKRLVQKMNEGGF